MDIQYLDSKDFLPSNVFNGISNDGCYSKIIDMEGSGISDGRYIFYLSEGPIVKNIISYIKRHLENSFSVNLELSSEQLPTLRILDKGHKGIHIHTDFSKNDKYQEIIAILYCNTINSGYFEFWLDNGEFFESGYKAQPIENRLIAFKSTLQSLHSVSPVYEKRISLNFTFRIK
ncbi:MULTISPECIES: 2OG-Fe(II) oxygenase [Vibrio]|uniref:2OG-Fe(II) oxygenase n=2 Tax=Vibrionaceae TaxID=641 RepID=UPI00211A30DA|nr:MULTISPECIES: 2OG-Fe(II) oxygenase [Vibrio]MCQ9090933.1 2OG-Fe(II) oxygenase [Vibrio alginolyticus]MDW1599399.1 2OG-Fe(II) oxygenase [Vibrio sp. Vb2960]CAK6715539.1 hypothetical protein HORM4_660025 [Vibrio harveyi]